MANCQHDYEVDSMFDAAEDLESLVTQHAARLLSEEGECYPFQQLQAKTALENVPYFVAGPIFRRYAKAFADKNRESREAHLIRAGEEFMAMLYDYWSEKAQAQAEKEIK